jgi:hypothetical protein
MLLAACALIFELSLAVVLWRLARQRPSIATKIASVFIGFAAAASLALAAQGLFLLGVNVLQASELAPTIFWLTSGVLAFVVVLALRPSPALATMPCIIIAALSFIYGGVQQEAMGAVVGAMLTVSAMVIWSSARRVIQGACAKGSRGDGGRPIGIRELAQ